MSLHEVLEQNLGETKVINVDTCVIYGDMLDDLDAINKKFFYDNLPTGIGNMTFVGGSTLIGQHYLTAGTSGVNADKSAMIEDTVSISFGSKDLSLIGDVQADKYIVNGGTSTELLAGDGSLVSILSLPDGNVKYTPISGNIGAHYQQSSLDGQSCIESNLSEDAFNFYFANRSIQGVDSVNCNRVNATTQLFTGTLGGSNTLITNNEVLIQNATTSNTKVNITGLEVKDNTSTTTYQARTITDPIELTLTTPIITSNGNITANSFAIPFGTNQYVLLADGTTAPYVAGGQSNLYLYRSSTSPTPTILGRIQWNTLPQNIATTIYINHLTDDNIDIDPFLAQIRPDDILYIQDQSVSTNWIRYTVLSTTVIPNSYTTLNVSFIDGEGTGLTNFPNNHQIYFSIFINTDLINQRLTALETKTRYQSSLTSNQTTFTNTLNTDIVNANHMYKIGDGEYITNTEADAVYLKIVNEANPLPITLSTSGSGTSLLNDTTNPSFSTKSLAVGTGLSIASTTDTITLTNTESASAITLTNEGANLSLIGSTSANPTFKTKSISASTGITINDASNNLEIVNSSPASAITLIDATTGGFSLIGTTSANPTFDLKKIVAGSNVSITDIGNQLTLSTTAGSTVNLTNGGANLSIVASTSVNPNLKNKSFSAGTAITINDASNNLEIVNDSPASAISLSSTGTGNSILNSTTNPTFTTKSLIAGSGISITPATDSLTITNTAPSASAITLTNGGVNTSLVALSSSNPTLQTKSISVGTGITLNDTSSNIELVNSSPASGITLTNAGTTSLIATASSNPAFQTKGLVAGTNITLSTTGTDITINSTGGGGGTVTGWDFLPMNIGIKNALLSTSSYFNLAIVPNTITINTIKFFIGDPLGSAQNVRWALYKGVLTTSPSGAVLQAQSFTTIPTSTIGIYTMTFTVEAGRSLTFNAGDAIWLGFCGSVSVQTFVSTGSSDLDNCFLVASSFVGGFPANISTGTSRVQTNIHNCALFHT